MASAEDDVDTYPDERPQHEVQVSSFYLGKYPVTQALWRAVVQAESVGVTQSHPDTSLDPSPSNFQGDDLPVERVSWDDAQLFIKKLNALTASSRLPGYVYRLPTETEWEYAVRGGKFYKEGYKYAGSDRLKDVGWFNDNSGSTTKPVGQKYPNQLGLHDMSGNVWEWCEDDWHDNYEGAPEGSSAWIDTPERGAYRVNRGGGWDDGAQYCRAALSRHQLTGPSMVLYRLPPRLVPTVEVVCLNSLPSLLLRRARLLVSKGSFESRQASGAVLL